MDAVIQAVLLVVSTMKIIHSSPREFAVRFFGGTVGLVDEYWNERGSQAA
ncbi:unnamed protein product [Penicillium roqueforti FM164]|uniref:Uncharacterized protein n=1 Tax=Penicillium roqueforti (strain FM164) TaxID=1365484 RepID=W6QS30_PENRF|nr:unnamed protein product [Penicillium roqueforti FM164]